MSWLWCEEPPAVCSYREGRRGKKKDNLSGRVLLKFYSRLGLWTLILWQAFMPGGSISPAYWELLTKPWQIAQTTPAFVYMALGGEDAATLLCQDASGAVVNKLSLNEHRVPLRFYRFWFAVILNITFLFRYLEDHDAAFHTTFECQKGKRLT